MYLVFEFARCLVPSRFLQLVKQRFYGTNRWSYVKPLYTDLYETLYEDLSPEKGLVHENTMEDQQCMYQLSPDIIKKSLEVIKKEAKLKMTHV